MSDEDIEKELMKSPFYRLLKFMNLVVFCVMSVFATILTTLGFRLYSISKFVAISCFVWAVICLIIGLVGKKQSDY